MSNTHDSGNGPPSEDEGGDTAWKASLMRRTEEVGHVQAQTGPVPDVRADARPPSEFSPVGARELPPRGAPGAAGMKALPGATAAPPRRELPPPPPPPPPARPLAAVLALGSGACALLAAVLLVLPELQQLRASSAREAPALTADTRGEEKTLAPRFDSSAPVPEGQVREQHETLQGISILMVESEPSGATVTVDGVKQGTSPVSFTPICTPGNPLRVKLVRKGFESLEHTTVCREDTMTQLSARLRRARGGAKP